MGDFMTPLEPGDTIGIISPASYASNEVFDFCRSFFAAHGYRIKVFGKDDARHGRLAATDSRRFESLAQAFADEDVKAILCSRGGYGSGRLLEQIAIAGVTTREKILIGYSDVTNLLLHFHSTAGMIMFHGPMAWDLMAREDAWSRRNLLDMISGQRSEYELDRTDFCPIRTGSAEGRLFGGNISIIESLVGTSSFQIPRDAILVLEDVNEFMYRIDRSIVHLKRVGLFETARAIVFADMKLKDGKSRDNSLGFTFEEVIEYHFADFDGPIAIDLPCGHTNRQLTLPIGATTKLHIARDSLYLGFQDVWTDNPTRIAA